MKYNTLDNIHYLTNSERLALTVGNLQDTSKYYEVDTKFIYIVYGGAWYAM